MDRSRLKVLELLVAVLVIAGALAYVWPHWFFSSETGRVYLARKNAEALTLALEGFATANKGAYPDASSVLGGDARDDLISGGFLLSYPKNPFRRDARPIRSVPFDQPSPGDFSYVRSSKKEYLYELIVYGDSGVVFEHRLDKN